VDEDAVGDTGGMIAETAEGTEILIHGNVRHIQMNEVENATGTGEIVTVMAATTFEVADRLHHCLGEAGHL
jgi:hypothetical protein